MSAEQIVTKAGLGGCGVLRVIAWSSVQSIASVLIHVSGAGADIVADVDAASGSVELRYSTDEAETDEDPPAVSGLENLLWSPAGNRFLLWSATQNKIIFKHTIWDQVYRLRIFDTRDVSSIFSGNDDRRYHDSSDCDKATMRAAIRTATSTQKRPLLPL